MYMSSLTASQQIDQTIAELNDWRGEVIADIRRIIREAEPDVVEAVKWRAAPVWAHGGNICVAGIFKAKVKLTFAHGAHLPDPMKSSTMGWTAANGVHWTFMRTISSMRKRSRPSSVPPLTTTYERPGPAVRRVDGPNGIADRRNNCTGRFG